MITKQNWYLTPFTKLLKIKLPIIQAPMAGGATTPELIAAVCNAGGLGSLGAGYMSANDIYETIQHIRKLTDKPFAVNLFIPETYKETDQQHACDVINQVSKKIKTDCQPVDAPYRPDYHEQLQVVLEEKVPVFSFTFGMPSTDEIKKLKNNSTIILGTATTITEAKALQSLGVDTVVAQGFEAGGHRGTFIDSAEHALTGNFALIPKCADALDVPVIAAGSIMDARGIIAALMLGASGVQMGTAFLTTTESGINAVYKQALLNSGNKPTLLTKAFSGKLARSLQNEFILEMEKHQDAIVDFPIQNKLTKTIRAQAVKMDKPEFMSLWSGQAAYLCQAISVSELIKSLVIGIEEQLQN